MRVFRKNRGLTCRRRRTVLGLLAAGWLAALLGFGPAAQSFGAEETNAPAAPRDLTFLVMSDPHIGVQAKDKPTRSTEQIVEDGRRQVERIAGVVGQPYPTEGPLRGLALGNVARPRGLLIAGDLTDNLRWDAFEAIFPPGGMKTAVGAVPVLLCVGNHDGPPQGAVRRGVIAQNRAHQQAGRLSAISEDGWHYAAKWDGVHILCLNLCPADTTDPEMPFKYGKPGPGSWNDPKLALTFLKNYLRDHVGKSGEPVLLMHHYGFDGFSTNDWYWWTPKQRRAYYDAIQGYNIAAILHGHNHHADHYLWPNPKADTDEIKRHFGDNPPDHPKSYDVFSCGDLCWVFHITGDRLIAAHWGPAGKSWDSGLLVVKLLVAAKK